MAVHKGGELSQQRGPLPRRRPPPGRKGSRGALDGGVRVGFRSEFDALDHFFRGRIDDIVDSHSRSNPRNISQSVTAASKAASSTRGAFVECATTSEPNAAAGSSLD